MNTPLVENARANAYRLLAAVLTAPPDMAVLAKIAALPVANSDDDCGLALARLRTAAADEEATRVADDYQELLIGLGRGKVVPYGSWHISGNMMDKPLAALRADLQEFGLRKQTDSGEPEDHIGALCETMAVLCDEEAGADEEDSVLSFSRQQRIFHAHLAPWSEIFFTDIGEKAESELYRAVGAFGVAFMVFERRYFEMVF